MSPPQKQRQVGYAHWIFELDYALSKPIYELELPRWLEWILSVPGSVFGMPLAMSMSPLSLAAVGEPRIAGLLFVEFFVFLIVWVFLVPRGLIRLLFKTDAVLPLLLGGNLYAVQTFHPARFGVACFTVCTFSVVVGIVAVLKRKTLRLRPNFREQFRHRSLPIGPTAVQSEKSPARTKADQHAALPSGDAASAASFCVSILLAPGGGSVAAWALSAVLLCTSCFGRLYWRHHHLLDVAVGTLLGATVSYAMYLLFGLEQGWISTVAMAVAGAGLNEFTAS